MDQASAFVFASSPIRATLSVWALWAISWAVAAIWSRRTVGRPRGVGRSAFYLPTLAGAALLFDPLLVPLRFAGAPIARTYWRAPEPAGWIFCAATVASFAFAWWARLSLGSLWSGSITRKEGHRVVDTGPYRLVRHPIYTGIIAASFVLAMQLGTPAAIAGAAIMTLGWSMKAREEERFLSRELGAAYDDYRRRTPMLVPFLGRRP
jgi:protein-S-isoprenylcysteine O-methyltransferase Ste14